MNNFEIARDVILLALGLFGTGLSIFNYVDARAKNKRQIKVTLSTAMPAYGDGTVGLTYAKVEATNIGHRDVVITSLFLESSEGGRLTTFEIGVFPGIPDTRLPIVLTDGHTAHRFYAYRDIGEVLRNSRRNGKQKITPVCEDSSGGIHRGKSWDIDPAEFIGM